MAAGQRAGPAVHDIGGVASVGLVAADKPKEGLRESGNTVALLILATEVRPRERAAFTGFPRVRRVSQRAQFIRLRSFEGRFPRLEASGEFAFYEFACV